jgi:hypothetical protein
MNDLISTRTGIAAIVAGLGYFTGQAGELVFGSPSHAIDVVFVVLGGIGLIALGVALWGLRGLLAQPRRVRIGLRIALAGALLLGLFTVQAVLAVIRTGHVPETFAPFGLGLLLVIIGQLLFASGLRPVIGAAWPLPILGALGAIVALTTDAYLTVCRNARVRSLRMGIPSPAGTPSRIPGIQLRVRRTPADTTAVSQTTSDRLTY